MSTPTDRLHRPQLSHRMDSPAMPSSSSESLDSRTVETDQDSADERTWLLAEQADTAKCCTEHATTSKTFGLWQFGALVGG